MRYRWQWCQLVAGALLLACSAAAWAAQVRIEHRDDGYRLLVDGAPFVIKGAGLGNGSMETLAARGGNALRTWRVDPDPQRQRAFLDRAQRNGLKVAVGIEVGNERHGFDYNNAAAVRQQLQRIRTQVQQSAAHPAVLMWVVGNELNLDYTNPKVWNAVGAIADAIHAIDPDHPVTTTLAGFDKPLIDRLKARAPSLDLIAVQLYGDIDALPQKLHDSGWRGPYVVTEWGPTGHWESPTTTWGAPIEDNSARKAVLLEQRYRQRIASDTRQGLGSFVFLWGNKQERTPTWYGLFLPSGAATPSVDALQALWTGRWPVTRAPAVSTLTLDGKQALDSVTLRAGHTATATLTASGATALRYVWQVRTESTARSIGGDAEALPPQIDIELRSDQAGDDSRVRLRAPAPGNYRLFLEVHDQQGRAGYANLPFRVEAP
nr:glycoside hydrolase family 2 TIM barrel-domain containing protein [Xanthomonas campestris]WVL60104.1 glycoside hydrolase family 2 TIM barrel-domain containing protein [Xanthomonas campestris pv. barbareae]